MGSILKSYKIEVQRKRGEDDEVVALPVKKRERSVLLCEML